MIETLAHMRKLAGFRTQEELSKAVGVERATIAKWESGSRYPRHRTLIKLAELLSVSEREIIEAVTAAKGA